MALEQCKTDFGILNYTLDYHELLSDPNISAIHLCSPNNTHFQIASEFLKHGKHVLVEKPLALKTSEAFELVRIAKENRRVLSTGHIHRFNNGVRALRRLLASGVLGDIYYLGLRWTGLMACQKNRDVISDLGPHPFDIYNNLLRVWPAKISCKGRGYRTIQSHEMTSIYAERPDGLDAFIELSWLDPEKHRDVTIVGSDGSAKLDCLDQRLLLSRGDSTERILVVPNNTIREEILHFTRCIEWNDNTERYPNLSDGMLGANVVRLLEGAMKSLEMERTISVDTIPEEPTLIGEQIPGLRVRT